MIRFTIPDFFFFFDGTITDVMLSIYKFFFFFFSRIVIYISLVQVM